MIDEEEGIDVAVYTASVGFTWATLKVDVPEELSSYSTKFPETSDTSFFEVWERDNCPGLPAGINLYGLIDWTKRGIYEVFFPYWIDVLRFLKEYIPMFKDIIQIHLNDMRITDIERGK